MSIALGPRDPFLIGSGLVFRAGILISATLRRKAVDFHGGKILVSKIKGQVVSDAQSGIQIQLTLSVSTRPPLSALMYDPHRIDQREILLT